MNDRMLRGGGGLGPLKRSSLYTETSWLEHCNVNRTSHKMNKQHSTEKTDSHLLRRNQHPSPELEKPCREQITNSGNSCD